MALYLAKRILKGIGSVVMVVVIVMALIYTCLDRNLIFAADPVFSRQKANAQQVYMLQQWEKYGYVDYISYGEYLSGVLSGDAYTKAVRLGDTAAKDSPKTKEYVAKFQSEYEKQGYFVVRLDAKRKGQSYQEGGEPRLYAYRDVPLLRRLGTFFAGLVRMDNIHTVKNIENPGLTFTLHDPVYGGKFAPAIMGNGTFHKYLLYFDNKFPFVHQNFLTLNLGRSYSVNQGVDVWQTMTEEQGRRKMSVVTYPTGLQALSADDLHSATYAAGSRELNMVYADKYTDDYTNVSLHKSSHSKNYK